MKKLFSLSLMVAAVALLALSVPVPAFSKMMDMPTKNHCEGHGHMMKMGDMDKMGDMMGMDMCVEHADEIGLTDDQMMKMKAFHSEMLKRQVRFNADLKIAEIELMEIMEVKDFNLEKAHSAANRIAEIKTAHCWEMLKAMKEMRTILTDEQFKKMKKMMFMEMSE